MYRELDQQEDDDCRRPGPPTPSHPPRGDGRHRHPSYQHPSSPSGRQRHPHLTDPAAASRPSSPAGPLGNLRAAVRTARSSSPRARGRAVLLLVAFLYGTLNVALRAVYATPGPPAASALSLVRQCLSALAFLPAFAMGAGGARRKGGDRLEEDGTRGHGKAPDERNPLREGGPAVDGESTEEVRPMVWSALELAFWNFGAQGLINAGLLFSLAARASFLTQTSVVMTPLVSALAGERIGRSVWCGCSLALLGLFLISTSGGDDDGAAGGATAPTLGRGDVMILLGALSWSIYIFRTSRLAASHPALDLQFAKTALLAVLYGGWALVAADGRPGALASLWPGWRRSPEAWLLLAYSAVGPGALADVLQQRGQRETSASEANVILCMEPVFATACALALLGEATSAREVGGGLLIVIAAMLASGG